METPERINHDGSLSINNQNINTTNIELTPGNTDDRQPLWELSSERVRKSERGSTISQ